MDKQCNFFGDLFFKTYCNNYITNGIVVDIGSKDYNGSLKEVCPKHLKYIGVDLESGKNVDIVLQDPYKLPFENNSIDFVVCSSAFYCVPFFWILFLEIMRILKNGGLFYLNLPSYGVDYCPYPIDCWRFFPDAGNALTAWGKYNNHNVILIESFISNRAKESSSNFFIGVFGKEIDLEYFKKVSKMTDKINHFLNAHVLFNDKMLKRCLETEDNYILKDSYIFKRSFSYKFLYKIENKIKILLNKFKLYFSFAK